MFDDFLAARNLSQKWKHEKRCIRTYTKGHLLDTLNYYKDLNYFSSNCLVVGTDAAGTSAYFAAVCMKTSIDAINYIEEILAKHLYKQEGYRVNPAPMDFGAVSFDARKGLHLSHERHS